MLGTHLLSASWPSAVDFAEHVVASNAKHLQRQHGPNCSSITSMFAMPNGSALSAIVKHRSAS